MSLPPKVAFKCPERTFVTVVSGRRDHRAVTLREACDEVLVSLPRAGLRPVLDQLSKVWEESPIQIRGAGELVQQDPGWVEQFSLPQWVSFRPQASLPPHPSAYVDSNHRRDGSFLLPS